MTKPFSCEECRRAFAAFPDLDAAVSTPEIATHLATCATCRIEYSKLRDIVAQTQSLPHFAAPADLRSRVRARIEAETTSKRAASSRLSLPHFRIPRWATTSLSGALVTACLLLIVMRQPPIFVAPERKSDQTPNAAPSNDTSSNKAKSSAKKSADSSIDNSQNGSPTLKAPTKLPSKANSSTRLAPSNARSSAPPNASSPAPFSNSAMPNSDSGSNDPSAQKAPSERSLPQIPPQMPPQMSPRNLHSGAVFQAPPTSQKELPQSGVSPRNGLLQNGSPRGGSLQNLPMQTSAPQRFARLEWLSENTTQAKTDATRSRDGARSNDDARASTSLSQEKAPATSANVQRQSSGDTARATRNAVPSIDAPLSDAPSDVAPRQHTFRTMNKSGKPSNSASQNANAQNNASADANFQNNNEQNNNAQNVNTQNDNARIADDSASSLNAPATSATAQKATATKSASTVSPPAKANASQSSTGLAGSLESTRSARQKTPQARAAHDNLKPDNAIERNTANAEKRNRNRGDSKNSDLRRGGSMRAPSNSARQSVSATPHRAETPANSARAAGMKQRARLTISPARDIARARVQLKWLQTSMSRENLQMPNAQTVWSGAAKRSRTIEIVVAVPIGNKNGRAQVSLQSADARGVWTTVDSTLLSVAKAR